MAVIVTSILNASPATVWAHASTMAGVNEELSPWMRMTVPSKGMSLDDMPIAPPGRLLFRSTLLLFGLVPIDRHALFLYRVVPMQGFEERSTSLVQRRWDHTRTLEGTDTCALVDRVEFETRIGLLTRPVERVVRSLFEHRHKVLRKKFGQLST